MKTKLVSHILMIKVQFFSHFLSEKVLELDEMPECNVYGSHILNIADFIGVIFFFKFWHVKD